MTGDPREFVYLTRSLTRTNDKVLGGLLPFYQSNLEKAAMAIRTAMKTVQYYSPNYDYYNVVLDRNDSAKKGFAYNEIGK